MTNHPHAGPGGTFKLMDLDMVSVKVVGPKGEPGVIEKQPSYLPISMSSSIC